MKFKHDETGLNFELTQIPNTDFWADKDGDLYLATHGTCERISGLNAVESILKRENKKTVVQVVCCQPLTLNEPRKYREKPANYQGEWQG